MSETLAILLSCSVWGDQTFYRKKTQETLVPTDHRAMLVTKNSEKQDG
jgi:hypothetical protein